MGQKRKLRRRGEKRQLRLVSTIPGRSFDLSRTLATDVSSIELDASDNTVTVRMQLPVGDHEGYAEYEEVMDLDEPELPTYLRLACNELAACVLKAVRERAIKRKPLPCATCTGACCGRKFELVRVTQADVERMIAGDVDVDQHVELWDPPPFSGYVGSMVLVPWRDTDEKACPFLRADGCSIYEHRPSICREFSPWTCDLYEEDPDKVDGKVRLRLSGAMTQEAQE